MIEMDKDNFKGVSRNMLEEVKKYLKIGWSVIPIKKDKEPFLKSWKEYQNRLPTEKEIKSWWRKWPKANIAVANERSDRL